ncbi:MAG: diguanylate cyclase [Planctomycetaceae bacterium]
MRHISSTMRIALSLTSLAITVILVAGMIGGVSDPWKRDMEHRTRLAETVAINFSTLASRADTSEMQKLLQAVVTRNPEIESVGVRKADNTLLIEVGDHKSQWTLAGEDASTETQMHVPVRSATELWGTVEFRFSPLSHPGVMGLVDRPEIRLSLYVAAGLLVVYYFYLRKVLVQLNPSKVVPNRVRDALDTLAEGLLIVDQNQRIVLANRAFEDATGRPATSLLGRSMKHVPFESRGGNNNNLPWNEAVVDGRRATGRLMALSREDGTKITFSCSASPIVDEAGVKRGAIASFEDVTILEEQKQRLSNAYAELHTASEKTKKQNRELEFLATRDALTGCLNRRSFFSRFDDEWKSAIRHKTPLSAVMVDIDHFKSVNDNHGHATGDEVLRKVAAVLQETARETDIVARYGGEEFSILMPHTDTAAAQQGAERIRVAISELKIGTLSVTASLGIASISEGISDPQTLLDHADKCLYVAKRNGRNQVVRYDQIPKGTTIEAKSSTGRTTQPVKELVKPIPFQAVTALISALAYRDRATAAHCRRVADLCFATAEGLLSHSQRYVLEIAGLLHDIGKIGVPDSILLKPGKLSDEEWGVMRRQGHIGVEIIRASFGSPELTAIIEHRHAHFDPLSPTSGPTGNQIPLGARILAISDAFDSMTSHSPHRQCMTQAEAFQELRRCAGTQFDPEIVERFINIVRMREESVPRVSASKELALSIGLEIEHLVESLEKQDLSSMSALASRLEKTATKGNLPIVAETARVLEAHILSDADLIEILVTANELLAFCRSTQDSFMEDGTRELETTQR